MSVFPGLILDILDILYSIESSTNLMIYMIIQVR